MVGQSSPRRVLLLVNPKSGQGKADVKFFQRFLQRAGVQVERRVLRSAAGCVDVLADVREFDAFVAAGGDGTVSSVAYAARGCGVPMLPYPAGTANLIAQNLNLPTQPESLARVLLTGHSIPVDLAELEAQGVTKGFAMIAGAGADAAMIRESEELKPRFGPMGYVMAAVRQVVPHQFQFHLRLDGRDVHTEGMSVLIANFGMVNFRLPVANGIDPSDGRLTVIVVKGRSVFSLLPNVLDSVRSKLHLGSAPFRENLEIYECQEVTVSAESVDEELPVQYDGETFETRLPVRARVLPAAIRFLTPVRHDDVAT